MSLNAGETRQSGGEISIPSTTTKAGQLRSACTVYIRDMNILRIFQHLKITVTQNYTLNESYIRMNIEVMMIIRGIMGCQDDRNVEMI